jgi:hypothetical protein
MLISEIKQLLYHRYGGYTNSDFNIYDINLKRMTYKIRIGECEALMDMDKQIKRQIKLKLLNI